jgi:hypothetical protein
MTQKQYVEKPRKVLAEQFTEGMSPDAVGVHRCGLSPLVESGPPHVHVGGQVIMLHDTDWILASKWAPDVPTGVMSDEEFQDTFGAGPPEGAIT